MSGSIKSYTPNFKMIIPQFNVATWHDYIEENFRSIDALFHNLFGINGFSGMWKTNTTYKANQVLFVGEDNGSEYEGRLVKVIQDTNTGGFATFSEAIKRYPNHYEMYADASSAEVYAALAKDWATKIGETIKTPTGEDTGEYSAKHYAQTAASHEEACEMYRNLTKTDSDLAKESELEATSQAQIAQTQATNAETSATNALNSASLAQEYANVANTSLNELKTTATDNFNTNASQKTTSFNNNYESKLSSFNTNSTTKTNEFNTNATKKIEQVNTIASSVSALVVGFDENVATKTSNFNKNAANRTTAFDTNATQQTSDFDSNALSKLNAFNSNVNTKTQAFNTNASEKQALVDTGASNAQLSAANAKTSETNAKTSENNAKSYSEQAESSATTATQMSNSASNYATTATTQAGISTTQAGIATTKANDANKSASTATSKANIATTKAQEASTSATNASSSATSASNSANLAESWAVGDSISRPEGSAKYWAQQASSGQIQSDWSQTDNTKKDFIKNKPTKLSQFTNDSNFVNTTQLATKQDSLTTAQLSAVNSGITSSKVSTYDGYQTQINNRQLTSNLSQSLDTSTTKYPSNNAVKTAIDNKANADLSNMNPSQSAKETIVGWCMPDYSAGVSLAGISSPYIAPANGIIYIERNIGNLKINGNAYVGTSAQMYSSYNNTILVNKGDSLSWTQNTPYIGVFYPMKGV